MNKIIIITTTFILSSSIATAASLGFPAGQNISQSIISLATSILPHPEVKGRRGSIRVGGYNSHGKGSRYIGGRK